MGSSTKRGSKGNLNKWGRKKLKYEVIEEDWGAKKTAKGLEEGAGGEPTPCSIDRQVGETKATEEPPPPLPPSTQNSPPSHTQSNVSPATQYSLDTPSMVPDDNLLILGRYVQGFPPVQVGPRVDHLHAGRLGDVTLRGGTMTSQPPIHTPPLPSPKSLQREQMWGAGVYWRALTMMNWWYVTLTRGKKYV